jgi:cytochrome c-type biogenesis protein CcmE
MIKRSIALIHLCAFAIALGASLTPSALLKDADKYDLKDVTVRGKVMDLKAKVSRANKAYFTFKLKDKDSKINVYGQGQLDGSIKEETEVDVTGIYRKLNDLQSFSVKNEVDVSPKPEKKYGVKKVE